MKRKRHSAEQIISKLREVEVLLRKGQNVPQAYRQLGVSAQSVRKLSTGSSSRSDSPTRGSPSIADRIAPYESAVR